MCPPGARDLDTQDLAEGIGHVRSYCFSSHVSLYFFSCACESREPRISRSSLLRARCGAADPPYEGAGWAQRSKGRLLSSKMSSRELICVFQGVTDWVITSNSPRPLGGPGCLATVESGLVETGTSFSTRTPCDYASRYLATCTHSHFKVCFGPPRGASRDPGAPASRRNLIVWRVLVLLAA